MIRERIKEHNSGANFRHGYQDDDDGGGVGGITVEIHGSITR